MLHERIKCTNCGGEYQEYDPQALVMRCERIGCGAIFHLKQAKEFADSQKDQETDIKNLRLLLDHAMDTKDIDLLARYSSDIRRLIPDDAYSAYCEALVQKKRGRHAAYHDFLKNTVNITLTQADKILAAALMEHNFTIHDKPSLEAFIVANFEKEEQESRTAKLNQQVERLSELRDRYAIVPRDVFICHASSDPIARKVYDTLTQDGVKCWFSQVNLPPSINNYWDFIKRAIRNCKIILVVSSINSMLRDDPEREMGYAAELGLHRLEFKVDNAPHNTFFRHFFQGLQWVYLGDEVNESFDQLKTRVYNLLHPVNREPELEMEAVLTPPTTYPLTVRYLAEDDKELSSVIVNLTKGQHTIKPHSDLVPGNHTLQGQEEVLVHVSEQGVSPGIVTFRFKVKPDSKLAKISLVYADEGINRVFSTEERELPYGEHKVKPDPKKLPKGHRLIDDQALDVSVKNGIASPARLNFRCALDIKPVQVKILYRSKDGVPLAADQARNLVPGEHKLYPQPKDIMPGYELVTSTPKQVTILGNQDLDQEVVFYYQKTGVKAGETSGKPIFWSRFGNKVLGVLITAWLLVQALIMLGATGVLYQIESEFPILMEMYREAVRFITQFLIQTRLHGTFGTLGTQSAVSYTAALGAALILVIMLLFGFRLLKKAAGHLYNYLCYLVLPVISLFFWLHYIPMRFLSTAIFQDKLLAFLQFLLPLLLVLLIVAFLKRLPQKQSEKRIS